MGNKVKAKTYTIAKSGGSAPTAAQQGLTVSESKGVACTLDVGNGITITSGDMQGYARMPFSADGAGEPSGFQWVRHTGLDWTPAAGGRYAASGDIPAYTGVGEVYWVPNLTLSGGTNVNVTGISRRDV